MGVMDVEVFVAFSILAFVFGYLVGVFVESSIGDHYHKKHECELESQLAAAIKERDRYKKSAIEAADIGDIAVDGLYRARLAIDELTNAVKSYRSETDGEGEE